MRLCLVGGTTATARIDGISAAGADPGLLAHTPSADLEVVALGEPARAPVTPVSPTGCPTPAVVTRAVRTLTGVETLAVDAGLARPTAAPTVSLDAAPGADLRAEEAVPGAADLVAAGRDLGGALPDDRLLVGETVPGGTTTARAVLRALGEHAATSSSLAENPVELKRRVVAAGLSASGLVSGDAAADPTQALTTVGDPVLAGATGLVLGALARGATVTLAGGTQMATVAALVRHAGVDDPLSLATTSFVADDETAAVDRHATAFGLDLRVTDPGFDRSHPATAAYLDGEAKEGVGMGGALALADDAGALDAVPDRVAELTSRLDARRAGAEAGA